MLLPNARGQGFTGGPRNSRYPASYSAALSQAESRDPSRSATIAESEDGDERDDPIAPQPPDDSQGSSNRPSERQRPRVERGGNERGQSDNSGLVASGRAAFNRDCTSCHDAQRALSRRKALAGWRTTIRRMAGKSGANIPSGDIDAIAAYLTRETNPAAAADTAKGGASSDEAKAGDDKQSEESSFSASGTFAPLWRGGNDNLQNPGFFPETWLGAAWQSKGVLSARATVCISCHNEPGVTSRVEVVEAALRLDLSQWLGADTPNVRANVDVGRFIVPFGAFSAQSNPGIYRTVTKPLIFNMGQRVFSNDIGVAVLPMPYADEGANFNLSLPVTCDVNATMDVYLVNGLQGTGLGLDFLNSRDYVDNNAQPSVGGRATVGNQYVRAGGSITGGRFNPNGGLGVFAAPLNYQIFGFDLSAHYEDVVRVQAEYAQRDSDTLTFMPRLPITTDRNSGYYVEGELRVYEQPRVSLLVRYDGQDRHALLPFPGSSLSSPNFGVRRFTYGVNFTLPGGSLLMINHEHWWLPSGLNNVDVIGARWAATF
jgi:cbb3-type cytochrome c oxidase subunit III